MGDDRDIQVRADSEKLVSSLRCEGEDFVGLGIHVEFICLQSLQVDELSEFFPPPFVKTIIFEPGEIITFMDGYDPSDWRKHRVLMDELSHHRVFTDDKVVAVFGDHVGDRFGHLWRIVNAEEIGRDGREQKILGHLEQRTLWRERDEFQVMAIFFD
jgi:hypothetical protein